MTRISRLALALCFTVVGATSARADQSVGLNVGYFAVRGEDSRVDGDVLLYNRSFLIFDFNEFNNASLGGDWLVGIGDFVEAGVGIGYYRRTVPTVYERFVDSDGTEIEERLALRVVPITATVRFLPLGRRGGFQPYIGGGVGLFNWRYSEVGEFIDFTDLSVFRDRFVADGADTGPIVLGGARYGATSNVDVGGEIRYHRARGKLGPGFLTDRIDLGGVSYAATFQVRF